MISDKPFVALLRFLTQLENVREHNCYFFLVVIVVVDIIIIVVVVIIVVVYSYRHSSSFILQ